MTTPCFLERASFTSIIITRYSDASLHHSPSSYSVRCSWYSSDDGVEARRGASRGERRERRVRTSSWASGTTICFPLSAIRVLN